MEEFVTKDEYANALRACQKSQYEMKSDARDKAEQVYLPVGDNFASMRWSEAKDEAAAA